MVQHEVILLPLYQTIIKPMAGFLQRPLALIGAINA
jgi:hypothetical protein